MTKWLLLLMFLPTPVRANSEVMDVNTAETAASKAFPPARNISAAA